MTDAERQKLYQLAASGDFAAGEEVMRDLERRGIAPPDQLIDWGPWSADGVVSDDHWLVVIDDEALASAMQSLRERRRRDATRLLEPGVSAGLGFDARDLDLAKWVVVSPEDERETLYQIELYRIRTYRQFIAWDAHLREKTWLPATDWYGVRARVGGNLP